MPIAGGDSMKAERTQRGWNGPEEKSETGRQRLSFAQIHSFGQVLSLANEAVLCVDADRRIVFCNDAASDLWGWSCSEAVGMPFDLLLPERYRKEQGVPADSFAAHPRIRVVGGN